MHWARSARAGDQGKEGTKRLLGSGLPWHAVILMVHPLHSVCAPACCLATCADLVCLPSCPLAMTPPYCCCLRRTRDLALLLQRLEVLPPTRQRGVGGHTHHHHSGYGYTAKELQKALRGAKVGEEVSGLGS